MCVLRKANGPSDIKRITNAIRQTPNSRKTHPHHHLPPPISFITRRVLEALPIRIGKQRRHRNTSSLKSGAVAREQVILQHVVGHRLCPFRGLVVAARQRSTITRATLVGEGGGGAARPPRPRLVVTLRNKGFEESIRSRYTGKGVLILFSIRTASRARTVQTVRTGALVERALGRLLVIGIRETTDALPVGPRTVLATLAWLIINTVNNATSLKRRGLPIGPHLRQGRDESTRTKLHRTDDIVVLN